MRLNAYCLHTDYLHRILSSPIPSTRLVGLSLCASHPKNVGYVEIQVQRASDYAGRQSIAVAYYPDLVFRFLQLFNGDWAPLLRDMALTTPASSVMDSLWSGVAAFLDLR
jgi:hypothetical protein